MLSFGASAQDPHYSQFNASPMTLNPALTGFYNGDFRVSANFRSQWGSFTDAFRTMSASFEISVLKGKLKDDNLAFGLMFFNDRAGAATFSTNYLVFSAAYRKTLGTRVKHALTFGLQGGMINQSVDIDQLIFDSQFNGIVVDPNLPTNETIIGSSSTTYDVNTGLLWHIIPSDYFNIYFGFSLNHILQPSIQFLANSDNSITQRYTAHVGSKINLTRLLNLLPSAVFHNQGAARQANFGSYLQIVLDDNYENQTAFSIGAWARIADPTPDAIILGARLDFQGVVMGISYDLNISDLTNASQSRGAYEISVIYIGDWVTRGQRRLTIPCPQL